MPDFKQYIEHLQQVASTRGGKMIVIVLLIISALLAAIRFMLWSGTLDPLEGTWRTVYNLAVLLFFLALAAGIASILWPKPKDAGLVSKSSSSARVSRSVETGWISRWALRVTLIWGLVIFIVVYAIGWVLLWQDLIYPKIHELTTTQFTFTSQSIIDLFIPL